MSTVQKAQIERQIQSHRDAIKILEQKMAKLLRPIEPWRQETPLIKFADDQKPSVQAFVDKKSYNTQITPDQLQKIGQSPGIYIVLYYDFWDHDDEGKKIRLYEENKYVPFAEIMYICENVGQAAQRIHQSAFGPKDSCMYSLEKDSSPRDVVVQYIYKECGEPIGVYAIIKTFKPETIHETF